MCRCDLLPVGVGLSDHIRESKPHGCQIRPVSLRPVSLRPVSLRPVSLRPVRLRPVRTGSLSWLALGIWTDQYGGRVMFPITMLCSAVATWLLSTVSTYPMMLLAALGVGLAGGSFAVSIPLRG